jgi:sugar lactone lactonase YvrE
VPARRPTSVCLGGPEDGRLFVSTARYGISDPAPEDGAILSARTDASALPAASFGRDLFS